VTRHVGSRISEVQQYLSKPVKNVKEPLKWWVADQHIYPNLSRMALDYLSIPGEYHFIIMCSITNFVTATSTTVERVFSQGRQLLSFTRNRLSASSIRAFLCLGSWGRNDLVCHEDLLAAVRENSKRKRDDESDVEVIE
jgi:hypothetical protein